MPRHQTGQAHFGFMTQSSASLRVPMSLGSEASVARVINSGMVTVVPLRGTRTDQDAVRGKCQRSVNLSLRTDTQPLTSRCVIYSFSELELQIQVVNTRNGSYKVLEVCEG